MRIRRFKIILFLLVMSYSLSNGQDIRVKASFDTTKIFIGDQIFYTVTVDKPSNFPLHLSTIKDTLCKGIEVIAGPVKDSLPVNNGRQTIVNKYLITSFDSGFYNVPPAYAELKNENGIKRYYSDYAFLEVMRVKITPPDTAAKIFDIIKPYKAPVRLGEILPWVLLALIVAAIIWGVIRIIRKYGLSRTKPEQIINPDPAHIIAFRDLEKLKEEQLWQKGEVKLYYSRLTEIVRQYLENRYGVYSLEMTTSETLEALVKTGFRKDELYTGLKTILNGSDLVKFAKYKPEPAENEEHFNNSWRFVDLTKVPELKVDEDKKIEEKS